MKKVLAFDSQSEFKNPMNIITVCFIYEFALSSGSDI